MYANRALRTVSPIRYDAWLAPVVDTVGAYYTGTGSVNLTTLQARDIGPVDAFQPPVFLPLLAGAPRVDVAAPANQIVGGFGPHEPPEFARPGYLLTYELVLTGLVSSGGLTARFNLIDDLGATVATLDVTDTDATAYGGSMTIPTGPRTYTLVGYLLSSSGPSDFCTPLAAAIRIAWS